ncbi:hypothetical protein ZIOFF_026641 [Zingiber officinale]|uniref:Uncharacterized protein n=1 Tax=Zingiber officinale TaxID=94328 RepID=A0A8J5GZ65_ZINOF|nr:hypothetical protein ZIOFF_026641 [Zingiber officinale]
MVGNNKKSGGGGGGWKKGVEKTKVAATSGFRKVKESTSTGVNWIKDNSTFGNHHYCFHFWPPTTTPITCATADYREPLSKEKS